MCPGLTSPGAKLYPAAADTIVVSFSGCNTEKNVFMLFLKDLSSKGTSDVLFWRSLLLLSHAFLVIFEDVGSNIIS